MLARNNIARLACARDSQPYIVPLRIDEPNPPERESPPANLGRPHWLTQMWRRLRPEPRRLTCC
jgi:hypothetical protein